MGIGDVTFTILKDENEFLWVTEDAFPITLLCGKREISAQTLDSPLAGKQDIKEWELHRSLVNRRGLNFLLSA